jgi:hypothetical protein
MNVNIEEISGTCMKALGPLVRGEMVVDGLPEDFLAAR